MLKEIKKKIKLGKYKLVILQISIISLFIIFLIVVLSPKNYTKNYKINTVDIYEEYSKKTKTYYLKFKYKDIVLDSMYLNKYKLNRGLIKNIKIYEDDSNFCIVPKGEIDLMPFCYYNNEQVYYKNVEGELKDKLNINNNKVKLIATYNDINIYNRDYTYLLWNYDGFYYINKKNIEKIDLFKKELYNVNLIGYTKNYLVVADYDSEYSFNNFYTINLKNGKKSKHSLKNSIYFDSYFPGYIKNDLYIVDSKENTMYKFNSKNGELKKVEAKIYNKGNWDSKSIKTLINTKEEFKYENNFNYVLEGNNIYLSYLNYNISTLIASNITKIVKIDNADIFYLKKDELYHFNPYLGEELLLSYMEWNFNYDNMIFIGQI